MSVLVAGQVLKEFGNGEAHIPFGKDYAIRLRNKHTDRYAVVKLFIDGEEQSKGGFIIPPSSYRDIERSSHSPRKFRFVALDSTEAQDHGKDQENVEKKMGVIEARFHLQKKDTEVKEVHHHHHHPVPYPVPQPYPYPRPYPRPWMPIAYDGVRGGQHTNCTKSATRGAGGLESFGAAAPEAMSAAALNDCGDVTTDFCPAEPTSYQEISGGFGSRRGPRQARLRKTVREGATVEGGHSTQKFGEQWVDVEDDYTTLKVTLKGFDPEQEVAAVVLPGVPSQPATAGAKFCDQCGAKAVRNESKFCYACGSQLP